MGQERVLNLIEQKERPLSRYEISVELDIEIHHVSNIIQRLIKNNEIKFKELSKTEVEKIYGKNPSHRRLRVYYV